MSQTQSHHPQQFVKHVQDIEKQGGRARYPRYYNTVLVIKM